MFVNPYFRFLILIYLRCCKNKVILLQTLIGISLIILDPAPPTFTVFSDEGENKTASLLINLKVVILLFPWLQNINLSPLAKYVNL